MKLGDYLTWGGPWTALAATLVCVLCFAVVLRSADTVARATTPHDEAAALATRRALAAAVVFGLAALYILAKGVAYGVTR